jgi:two-component system, NtrC family, sensor kinase
LVEEVLPTISGLPQAADRQLEFHPDPNEVSQEYAVSGNAGELKQVLVNLLVNAIEATAPGMGKIHLGLARKNGKVELTVSDNGRGMTPQTLEHVFEPFFSDKRTGHGTGLGLSITHAIVEDHGGSIMAYSEGLGQGSRFLLILPATSQGVSRE